MHKFNLFYTLNRHFQENLWLYIISLLSICTGIVLGLYTVKYMNPSQMNSLLDYFIGFADYVKSTTIDKHSVLLMTIKTYIPMMIVLWILGFTVFGIPLTLIINLIKGFTIGFTLGFTINALGMQGVWISLAGVIPQNLIYIPCLLFASVFSMENSLNGLKGKFSNYSTNVANLNSNYSINFLILMLIMFFGFIIEAYFAPSILKLILSDLRSVLIC
jgi:stage II sporulation protein M